MDSRTRQRIDEVLCELDELVASSEFRQGWHFTIIQRRRRSSHEILVPSTVMAAPDEWAPSSGVVFRRSARKDAAALARARRRMWKRLPV